MINNNMIRIGTIIMKNLSKSFVLICIIVTFFLIGNDTLANAATKDSKKPTITLNQNIKKPTKGNVKITIKATDASGIKTVKWASGSKTASYFKKDGTTLKLNSKKMATVTVKKKGVYSFYVVDKAGNSKISKIKITNIDRTSPALKVTYSLMNQVTTIKVTTKDMSGIKNILYLKGKVTDTESKEWETKGKPIADTNRLTVKSGGTFSILATDNAGNKTIKTITVKSELRAVWISYLEFSKAGYTESNFKAYIDEMYDNTVKLNMNAVIVQVRPFGDTFYPSNYFPWSKYISGEQGVDPGFDPLAYMVEAAHERNLEFHAWLNPYRVTLNNTDYSSLSLDNPARMWQEDDNTENDRNTLKFGKNLYYNPASLEVQELIINDITDIVKNYEVDGIHFDDYFYPTLGTKYKTTFDNKEYSTYKQEVTKSGDTPLAIDEWRRANVNSLVRGVYAAIKEVDSSVRFGISPHGNISNLIAKDKHYVDIEKWLSSSDYIDYIAPQIYWSFEHTICPYDKTVDRWLSLRTSDTVSMYVGIATYKAKSNLEPEWEESDDVLKRQVEYGRDTEEVDGYMFFRYESFFKKNLQVEVDNLISILE